MGRVKKNRGRRDDEQPGSLHWTPLQQSCGCVVEWGWDMKSPPPAFVDWCLKMTDAPCLWCGAETGEVNPPKGVTAKLRLPGGLGALYTQEVRPERRELGVELTRQAVELRKKLREDDVAGVLVDIPAKYQRVMRAKGYNPAETWIEAKMTDIFLNLGRVTLTEEMIEMLPEPRT